MPLVTCEDCGKEVSDRAMSCPACGGPMPSPGDRTDTQTVQSTSKGYKAWQVIGVLVVIFGMMAGIAGQQWGYSVMAIGAGAYIVASFAAWWDHG